MFPYHFNMKGMLLAAKSFCFFEINAWSLPPKNFNFSIQNLKPVERWKVAYVTSVNCQYSAGILSYLEDSCFRIILKGKECVWFPNIFAFLRLYNAWSLPPNNVNFLTQKLKPVQQWKVVYVTRVNIIINI